MAEKYIKLIHKNYEETGCLWEKYSGITAGIAESEYKTQSKTEMMGWTAGVYLTLSKELEKTKK